MGVRGDFVEEVTIDLGLQGSLGVCQTDRRECLKENQHLEGLGVGVGGGALIVTTDPETRSPQT